MTLLDMILIPILLFLIFNYWAFIKNGRKLFEGEVVLNALQCICWILAGYASNYHLVPWVLGTILLQIGNIHLILKLYPTPETTYFRRRNKDAVQRDVRGKEKCSEKAVHSDQDRDISKDH